LGELLNGSPVFLLNRQGQYQQGFAEFIGAVGHGEGFAPCTCFGNAEGVLSEDVRSDVVFGADDEGGENARIGVDLLNNRTLTSPPFEKGGF
jgi:hypothetical protein